MGKEREKNQGEGEGKQTNHFQEEDYIVQEEIKWVDCEYCGEEYPIEELCLEIEIDDFYTNGYRETYYCDSCIEEHEGK